VISETAARGEILDDRGRGGVGRARRIGRVRVVLDLQLDPLFELMSGAFRRSGLSFRQRGILVAAAASTLGDSYCSLAWGGKLAGVADAEVAAGVLSGTDDGLTDQERALAAWARSVVRDPNGTTAADVQQLRDQGLTDEQVFAVTAFVALRLAFSTVNDALGASPDAQLAASVPAAVRTAVSYGRPAEADRAER
jgi:alkylhydroperoxidase/carboxymuconolactone decarboxylase family protein YurZ